MHDLKWLQLACVLCGGAAVEGGLYAVRVSVTGVSVAMLLMLYTLYSTTAVNYVVLLLVSR